ncbi:MAG: 16S rRNA (guanine(527)-N(7))-methyltransferase RsmG [Ornithinimicrobium sp.]|uniref:16S rRNA (guanine(527)-N(7))-methyltransferase RsmG n=1 Tax=Ornithinimicrobium sp. TaxID=1977084 RepID=UPI003D9B45C5
MKPDKETRILQPPPRAAAEIFGERLPLAVQYAEMLAATGIEHGLIGPREGPRLWERHLLNCAVIESLLPHQCRVLDVGTGAGLPGIVLAIARPDLQITLIEPLERRTRWLEAAVDQLRLSQVSVRRGRAQDLAGRMQVPVVTARAVAPLELLVAWAWPLLCAQGRLLALKGQTAQTELEESRPALNRLGVEHARVIEVGGDVIQPPTRVIDVMRSAAPGPEAPSGERPPVTDRRSPTRQRSRR